MNEQQKFDAMLAALPKEPVPTLLLHSCCAPCSSYVIEYLSEFFSITVFYYNPNIYPETEYKLRVEEQTRLLQELPAKHPVSFLEGDYLPNEFFELVKGHEQDPEGGERCEMCYRRRLTETAFLAKDKNFDFFTTTLSISPLKDADVLNKIGKELENTLGVKYLSANFKKKDGYKRSIELSKEYDLYRQNYCGCIFSKRTDAEQKDKKVSL